MRSLSLHPGRDTASTTPGRIGWFSLSLWRRGHPINETMKSLTGKVAIVTGAGRGIGKAISLFLGGSGARVVLASRSESELRAVAGEIRNQDGDALVVPTDLTRDEEMDRLVRETLEQWGKHSPVIKTR